MDCCGNLFDKFYFENIKTANPPDKKGVYVIRVKKKGKRKEIIRQEITFLLEKLDWGIVNNFIKNRMNRIEKIENCSVIYIGSGGTKPESNNTLKKRYKELSDRHTAMFPIWALVYFGWELEYGWIVEEDAGQMEKLYKNMYRNRHQNKLPALVVR